MKNNRSYISYSQYKLFLSSPKSFYKRYVRGQVPPATKYQEFGKKLMRDLEFGEMSKLPKLLRFAISTGNIEHEIRVKSEVVVGKDLFGYIDAVSDDFSEFTELKTGKHAWTLDDVKNNEQLLFYALMIYLKYDIIPTAELVWVETKEDEDGILGYTGKVKSFTRKFSLKELVRFEKKIAKTVKDIKDYVFDMRDIEGDKDALLVDLLATQKEVEEKISLIKDEIMLDMQEFGNKYGESENFNYTLAVRKSYVHSEQLKEESAKAQALIKRMKKEEIDSGVAKLKTTEYLLIKPKK